MDNPKHRKRLQKTLRCVCRNRQQRFGNHFIPPLFSQFLISGCKGKYVIQNINLQLKIMSFFSLTTLEKFFPKSFQLRLLCIKSLIQQFRIVDTDIAHITLLMDPVCLF